jgi:hypothetical protein
VSLHSFGGFLYYPWGGLWKRPPDDALFAELGTVMQSGQGAHSYTVKQLCHWGFLFRIHGAELDHLYGKYGTLAFLIELTRTGIEPTHLKKTWGNYFRRYNPRDPSHTIESGVGALHARSCATTISPPLREPHRRHRAMILGKSVAVE